MTTRHIARMAAAILLAVSTAQADVIHVDAASCPGPGDGSVGDPCRSLQTAIDNAVDTDEVIVAAGTYFETIDFLGKAIWLHSSGGAEVTTIDGVGEPHVVQCVSSEGPDTVLDGFTITGGNADGAFPDNVGGGMRNSSSSPTVTNCTFSGNSANSSGGGMHNASNSRPTVTNCAFIGNSTVTFHGGGLFNTSSSPTVTNCTFTGNSANLGGGMYSQAGSSPLRQSSSNTSSPSFLPSTRATLVAPMFLLPCSRMSMSAAIFAVKYPNGSEPIRYANRTTVKPTIDVFIGNTV